MKNVNEKLFHNKPYLRFPRNNMMQSILTTEFRLIIQVVKTLNVNQIRNNIKIYVYNEIYYEDD